MALRATSASERGHINFGRKVDDFIDRAEKYAKLRNSPKRLEFMFCDLLAGWESTARRDSKASCWFEVWQPYCRRRHRGKAGRTLADPVKANPLPKRRQVPHEEETKAYAKVREGLRNVFKATLRHYYPESPAEASLMTGTDEPAILFQKIRASFRSPKSFASPEGLEIFLLTLIELFEESLGTEDDLFSRKAWRSEIQRRRLGGSPETKTLADVASPEVRLERGNTFPEKERTKILQRMFASMRDITNEFRSYLEKYAP
ncbi:MAG: hypothetical protein ACYC3I_02910 [Gemmataceae bacterium]